MHGLRTGFLALTLPLAACMGEGTGENGLGFLSAPEGAGDMLSAPVVQQVSLFRGNVVVAGPKGYCIDRQSLSRGANGAFVLIASCESLTGQRGDPVDPAVLTVSILPRQAGAEQPSAADLSRLAGSAKPLQSSDGDGLSYVRLAEGGDSMLPEGDPRHWRGAMLINGHVVGLAVYGPKGSAVVGRLGRNLLLAQAKTIRSLSPVRDYTPAAGADTNKPAASATLPGELFPESN